MLPPSRTHEYSKRWLLLSLTSITPTSNAEEAEVEWLYEDLKDLLKLTPEKDVFFIIGDWNAREGSQEIPEVTGEPRLGV